MVLDFRKSILVGKLDNQRRDQNTLESVGEAKISLLNKKKSLKKRKNHICGKKHFLNQGLLSSLLIVNSTMYLTLSILYFLLISSHDFHVYGFIPSGLPFSDSSMNVCATTYSPCNTRSTTMFLYHKPTNAANYLSKFQASSLHRQSHPINIINTPQNNKFNMMSPLRCSEGNLRHFANQSSDTTEKKRNVSSKVTNRNVDQDESPKKSKIEGKNKYKGMKEDKKKENRANDKEIKEQKIGIAKALATSESSKAAEFREKMRQNRAALKNRDPTKPSLRNSKDNNNNNNSKRRISFNPFTLSIEAGRAARRALESLAGEDLEPTQMLENPKNYQTYFD